MGKCCVLSCGVVNSGCLYVMKSLRRAPEIFASTVDLLVPISLILLRTAFSVNVEK